MGNKYGAVKVKEDGITFASKMEHRRYCQLKVMQKAGLIDGLRVQPKFPIIINGVNICSVILDFEYYNKATKSLIHEDTKGFWPPISRLKFKLLKAIYPEADVRLLTQR